MSGCRRYWTGACTGPSARAVTEQAVCVRRAKSRFEAALFFRTRGGNHSPLIIAPADGDASFFSQFFTIFLRMGVREQRRRESDAVAPGLLQSPALRPPLLEEATHVRDQDLSRASGVGGDRGH